LNYHQHFIRVCRPSTEVKSFGFELINSISQWLHEVGVVQHFRELEHLIFLLCLFRGTVHNFLDFLVVVVLFNFYFILIKRYQLPF